MTVKVKSSQFLLSECHKIVYYVSERTLYVTISIQVQTEFVCGCSILIQHGTNLVK